MPELDALYMLTFCLLTWHFCRQQNRHTCTHRQSGRQAGKGGLSFTWTLYGMWIMETKHTQWCSPRTFERETAEHSVSTGQVWFQCFHSVRTTFLPSCLIQRAQNCARYRTSSPSCWDSLPPSSTAEASSTTRLVWCLIADPSTQSVSMLVVCRSPTESLSALMQPLAIDWAQNTNSSSSSSSIP